jgi:uncharacterized protein YecT (DUF1311 family)
VKTRTLLLAAAALLAATAAQGATLDPDNFGTPATVYTQTIAPCVYPADTCLEKALAVAEQDLNKTYQKRLAILQRPDIAGLRTAEQAWATSRQLDCDWIGHNHPEHGLVCMLEGSINRKFWLMRNIGE